MPAQLTRIEPRQLVYSPGEATSIGLDYLRKRREDVLSGRPVGVPFGVPSIDQDLLPLLPGELMVLLARPGHGKTAVAVRWARWWAEFIRDNPKDFDRSCVVFISTEQSVEELNAFMAAAGTHVDIEALARGQVSDRDWAAVEGWAAKRATLPLFIIGHSQERRKSRIPMRMDIIVSAVDSIEKEFGVKPSLCVLDWIQMLKAVNQDAHREETKMLVVEDNLARLKEAALYLGCPWVATAQAGRQVDKKEMPLPEQEDGQHSSSLEQYPDKIMSMVRPRKYKQDGQMFGEYKVIGDNQLLTAILKQKMARANILRMISLDPRYNQLDDLNEKFVQLNPIFDQE